MISDLFRLFPYINIFSILFYNIDKLFTTLQMMNMEQQQHGEQNEQTKPPLLGDQDIITLCATYYDIHVERVKELNSYDDRNYIVHTSNGDKFVLKMTNSYDSEQPGLLNGQNNMILFLSSQNFNVPCPIKNIHGDYLARIQLPMNNPVNPAKTFAIRLFTYVDGIILYNVPIERQLLIGCGQFLARIDLALEKFDDKVIRTRKFFWSLANVPKLYDYLNYIKIPSRNELVLKCVKDFEQIIVSSLDSMKQSYLHGDFNEQNIIVRKIDNAYQIYGLIDFGDIFYGPRIYDIAIFIAYVMLLDTDFDCILEAPKFVLQGYCSLISLDNQDINNILICARARIAQSLTLGAYTHSFQPDNEYLLTTAKKGWSILERLCSFDDDQKQLIKHWMDAANISKTTAKN